MKTLYLDIFSGLSGDMFIGAMLDVGVDFDALQRELQKLELAGYQLHVSRQQRAHIAGTKFDVEVAGHEHHGEPHCEQRDDHQHRHAHSHSHSHANDHTEHQDKHHSHRHDHGGDIHADGRTFANIEQLIIRSELSTWVKQKSVAIFKRIAVAEGKIHGQPAEQVHFHEVGAIDSIIDIVGACVALELLGTPRLLAAPVVEGTGWVNCAHGRFPVPTPATLEILSARGVRISQCDEEHELVTPTGAALLAELVESFGPMRDLAPVKIGYGLGTRENQNRPNVVRAVLGDSGTGTGHDWETDVVVVLQTNLDDANAEVLGGVIEKALMEGALDVFHTPIQMKKNRPGVLLTLLCTEEHADKFCELILRETTSFGIRRHTSERRKLQREFVKISTHYGEVTVKLGKLDGRVIQTAPEYESCKRVAENTNVPIKHVYQAALSGAVRLPAYDRP
jgi:pyridinium-3,5-bisthiocarboxylic acid mononucleotide nickel chelatase